MTIPKHKYRTGQRVEVKLVGRGGAPHRWAPGTLLDFHGKGASVRVNVGRGYQDFFHWSDVREPEQEQATESQPLATLGEISARHSRPPLRALPPYLDTDQPGAMPEPAPESARKEAVLITHEGLRDMAKEDDSDRVEETAPRRRRKHQRRAHSPTPIGNLFKQYRLQKGLGQIDFAELIKSQSWRICRIELGDAMPTDGELLEFSFAFGVEIEDLERMRKASAEPGARSLPASAVIMKAEPLPLPPEPPAPRAPEPPAPAAPAPAPTTLTSAPHAPAEGEPFEDFVERLDGVVAIPTDKETRKLWFAMARRFYELAKS